MTISKIPWFKAPVPAWASDYEENREKRAREVASLVAEVQDTEHRYLLHGDRRNPVTLPWMPYQPADFIGIIWECMPELAGPYFMDVGCGPGTKMLIAQKLFGLDVHGVEIDPVMRAEAQKKFTDEPRVYADGDALELSWKRNSYDLFWLYRPFRDRQAEYRLEQKIIANMKPGAILAGASWETDIPALGWIPIVDDCLHAPDGNGMIIRGAWQKPE